MDAESIGKVQEHLDDLDLEIHEFLLERSTELAALLRSSIGSDWLNRAREFLADCSDITSGEQEYLDNPEDADFNIALVDILTCRRKAFVAWLKQKQAVSERMKSRA